MNHHSFEELPDALEYYLANPHSDLEADLTHLNLLDQRRVQVTKCPIVTIYICTLLAWAKCFLATYGEYPALYDLLDTPRSVLQLPSYIYMILHFLGFSYLIQFPPEMDENWVRYGLAKLGQISRLPNWQRMLFCAYTTQLLHSTGEGCWNNKDSNFIWSEFVCRNSGQIASRRSWKRSCLGLEYTSKCSRLALLWEPN